MKSNKGIIFEFFNKNYSSDVHQRSLYRKQFCIIIFINLFIFFILSFFYHCLDKKKCKKKIPLKPLSNNYTIFSAENIKQRRLPTNFAENVLTLELELEKPTVDIMVVNKLVELYTVKFNLLSTFLLYCFSKLLNIMKLIKMNHFFFTKTKFVSFEH